MKEGEQLQDVYPMMADDTKEICVGLFTEAAQFAKIIEMPKPHEPIGLGDICKVEIITASVEPACEARHFIFRGNDLDPATPLPVLAQQARDEIHAAANGSLWEHLFWREVPIVATERDFERQRTVTGLFLRGSFYGRIAEKTD